MLYLKGKRHASDVPQKERIEAAYLLEKERGDETDAPSPDPLINPVRG